MNRKHDKQGMKEVKQRRKKNIVRSIKKINARVHEKRKKDKTENIAKVKQRKGEKERRKERKTNKEN